MWARDPRRSSAPVGLAKATKRLVTARRLASAKHTAMNVKSEETTVSTRGKAAAGSTI
jgi:hypothetical protein